MKEYIEKRIKEETEIVINTGMTIREVAKKFGVSKSTVHKDIRERLPQLNPQIAAEAIMILEFNKAERHIRGGKATKNKYAQIKNYQS